MMMTGNNIPQRTYHHAAGGTAATTPMTNTARAVATRLSLEGGGASTGPTAPTAPAVVNSSHGSAHDYLVDQHPYHYQQQQQQRQEQQYPYPPRTSASPTWPSTARTTTMGAGRLPPPSSSSRYSFASTSSLTSPRMMMTTMMMMGGNTNNNNSHPPSGGNGGGGGTTGLSPYNRSRHNRARFFENKIHPNPTAPSSNQHTCSSSSTTSSHHPHHKVVIVQENHHNNNHNDKNNNNTDDSRHDPDLSQPIDDYDDDDDNQDMTPVTQNNTQQHQQQHTNTNNHGLKGLDDRGNHNNHHHNSEETTSTTTSRIRDGMNLTALREWAERALWEAPGPEATYVARLLYSKDPTLAHALLLAQAYLMAQEPASCWRLLQEAQLVGSPPPPPPPAAPSSSSSSSSLLLSYDHWIRAIVLACQSLSTLGDWTTLVELLEDICRLSSSSSSFSSSTTTANGESADTAFRPHFSNFIQEQEVDATTPAGNPRNPLLLFSRPLEDDDDFGWEMLQESMTQQQQQQLQSQEQPQQQQQQDCEETRDDSRKRQALHPLARICIWRGRAYYETGHVLRAAVYWKRALTLDGRAMEAYWALLDHQLLTPLQAHDLVQQLDFTGGATNVSGSNSGTPTNANSGCGDSGGGDYGWLKALYLTRIELSTNAPAATTTTSSSSSYGNATATTTMSKNHKDSLVGDPMMTMIKDDENHVNQQPSPAAYYDGNNYNQSKSTGATAGGRNNMTTSSSFSSATSSSPSFAFRGSSGGGDAAAATAATDLDASSISLIHSPPPPPSTAIGSTRAGGSRKIKSNNNDTHHPSVTPGAPSTTTGRAANTDGATKETKTVNSSAAAVQANVDEAFDQLRNVYRLHNSPQVLAMSAQRAYRRYQWKQVLQYCEQLSHMDPTLLQPGGGSSGSSHHGGSGASCRDVAYVYVAALLLAGHKRTLFDLAHRWVEAQPQQAASWFAVGAYYSACGRPHVAQRHYCRATRLDPQCTQAWIAFGCAFAACDESDQALASFRAAQRLSPGEHTSLLYMGMEYTRTNHLVLAHNFINTALEQSGGYGDPLCWHELGVLAAQKGKQDEAQECFQKVLRFVMVDDYYYNDNNDDDDVAHSSSQGRPPVSLTDLVEMCVDPYWEPTVFNLGHALRKLRHYEAAQVCYGRCVALCPDKCSGYSAYGLVCQLLNDTDTAVDYYHHALSCQPDDTFASEMLHRALAGTTGNNNNNHHHNHVAGVASGGVPTSNNHNNTTPSSTSSSMAISEHDGHGQQQQQPTALIFQPPSVPPPPHLPSPYGGGGRVGVGGSSSYLSSTPSSGFLFHSAGGGGGG